MAIQTELIHKLHTQKSGNPFFICWILADYFKLEKTSFGYTLERLLRISWEILFYTLSCSTARSLRLNLSDTAVLVAA